MVTGLEEQGSLILEMLTMTIAATATGSNSSKGFIGADCRGRAVGSYAILKCKVSEVGASGLVIPEISPKALDALGFPAYKGHER